MQEQLHVTVFPGSRTTERLNREENQHTYEILIAVQKAVDPDDVEAVDGLLEHVQNIFDLFDSGGGLRGEFLADCEPVGGPTNEPMWNPDKLQSGEFLSIVVLTYQHLA